MRFIIIDMFLNFQAEFVLNILVKYDSKLIIVNTFRSDITRNFNAKKIL